MKKAVLSFDPVFTTIFDTSSEAKQVILVNDQMDNTGFKAAEKRVMTAVNAAKRNYGTDDVEINIGSWKTENPTEVNGILRDAANSIDNVIGFKLSYSDIETIDDDDE